MAGGHKGTKSFLSTTLSSGSFEYLIAPSNNLWSGKTIFIKSFSSNKPSDKDFLNAGNLQYSNRKWIVSWQHEIVGNNFNAEVGYVPRNNYIIFISMNNG